MQYKDRDKKAAVALSGGVDSTAAALKLMEQGYECFGITMYLFDVPDEEGRLTPPAFLNDARRVADALGMEHHIIDLRHEFKKEIIDPFAQAYIMGKTPNPCVICNRTIKYGRLLDEALALGADVMATGHYARIKQNSTTGLYELYKGRAARKDQAYVMHSLKQQQLERILFPLGDVDSKDEIRRLVKSKGVFTAEKKDSWGICFVPDGDHGAFIERIKPGSVRKGNFVDEQGQILGQHMGLANYTIGQKRGLGLSLNRPVTVTELRTETNEVVLGDDQETYAAGIRTSGFNMISGELDSLAGNVQLKMFNWGLLLDARAQVQDNGDVVFTFLKPERAPAKGQHAVVYCGDRILGGGEIAVVIREES